MWVSMEFDCNLIVTIWDRQPVIGPDNHWRLPTEGGSYRQAAADKFFDVFLNVPKPGQAFQIML